MTKVDAQPYAFEFEPTSTALVIIDMQRDFVDPGGFGEALGNDVSLLRTADRRPPSACSRGARTPGCSSSTPARAIAPTWPTCRPPRRRAASSTTASAIPARWGASWCAASTATTSSTSSSRAPGEPVMDKPGKGAFYATDLDAILQQPRHHAADGLRRHHRGVRPHHRPRGQRPRLRLPGARGLRRPRTSPSSSASALEMIKAQGGIFGWVAPSAACWHWRSTPTRAADDRRDGGA